MKLTPEQRQEIKDRADRATPGTWSVEDWLDTEENEVYVQARSIGTVAVCQNLHDAEFIAATRPDWWMSLPWSR